MIIELVEIETHTTSKSIKECFLLVFYKLLILIYNKLELDDLFWFKFVLHQIPAGDSTI
jgi:hypothetical protein